MPHSLTATGVEAITWRVAADDVTREVTGISVAVNVMYGDQKVSEQFDLWATMDDAEREIFQTHIYRRLRSGLIARYLA